MYVCICNFPFPYRWRGILAFMRDLSPLILRQDPPNELDVLVGCYTGNTTLSTFLDRNAPIKTKVVTARPKVPLYMEEIREAKRERRGAERRWRTSKSVADFNLFKVLKIASRTY